jgi:DNA-binding response OmpR family regulator
MANEAVLRGLQVLVCEDEEVLARDLCDRLTAEGATIVGPLARVADAEAAIVADRAGIDAAVLDWNLADGTTHGIGQLLSHLGIPFLFCTNDVSQVRGWGHVTVLAKSQLEWVMPRLATLLGR